MHPQIRLKPYNPGDTNELRQHPMDLGTPLTAGATRVLLLGSGELGKELTIAFQRLGVEVIAVDRYENAPAHQVAHRAHVIEMHDPAALRRLVELERPHLIVPEIEAIATSALADLEREAVSVVVPTARAVQLTMNREGIRLLAADELGIPTSRFSFADSYEELHDAVANEIGYPCFVKPVTSSSGKGQSMVTGSQELEQAWRTARSGARIDQARVIVESAVAFDFEITLLTVRANGPHGQVETHFCEPIGHRQVSGDYVESWQPQPLSATALREAQHIAERITSALGGLGLFGVELFVRGDSVIFNEVSPRPHDTGLVTLVTQAQNEFELHARAILGLPVSTALRNVGASHVIYGELERAVVRYSGLEAALAVPCTDLRLFGKPVATSKRRMGVALATGTHLAEARERAKLCASQVRPVKSA